MVKTALERKTVGLQFQRLYHQQLCCTKTPLIITISFAILKQSRVILSFVLGGQAGRVRCIVINTNFAPTQMIDGTEKPIRSLQTCSAIQ